jgi:hypothetical protein
VVQIGIELNSLDSYILDPKNTREVRNAYVERVASVQVIYGVEVDTIQRAWRSRRLSSADVGDEVARLNGELQACAEASRAEIAGLDKTWTASLGAASRKWAGSLDAAKSEIAAKDACVAQLGCDLAARDADLKCYKAVVGCCVLESGNPFSVLQLDPRSLSSEPALHAAVTDAGNQELWAQHREAVSAVGAVAIEQEQVEEIMPPSPSLRPSPSPPLSSLVLQLKDAVQHKKEADKQLRKEKRLRFKIQTDLDSL